MGKGHPSLQVHSRHVRARLLVEVALGWHICWGSAGLRTKEVVTSAEIKWRCFFVKSSAER
jgi:hypothetical protein